MGVAVDGLIAALRSEGLRITPARAAVCEVLAARSDEHLDVSSVHELAEAAAGRPIDQSTVYRTLETLEETGVVGHVHLADRRLVHLVSDAHHHLTCDECGKTVDIPSSEVTSAFGPIAARHGYSLESVHFAVVARCDECSRLQADVP
jgi:Fur family transcriptional regulator, ferric uptake regulator